MKIARYEIWGHNVNEDTLEEMTDKAILIASVPCDFVNNMKEIYSMMLDYSIKYQKSMQYYELILVDGDMRKIEGSFSFY